MSEFEIKQARIRALLDKHQLDGLLLNRVSSFAWATCGGDAHVNTAESHGIASLWVTRDARCLITSNIEAPRLEQEENLRTQDWEFQVTPWYQGSGVGALTHRKRFGADEPYEGALDLSSEIAQLRANLTPDEGKRMRALGKLCAEAMAAAVRAVQPGMSEFQIAAQLDAQTRQRGVEPIVNLIATDDRISRFRHPIPTGKTLERYAMLILCGRKSGLVCSITRLVYFGRLPDELRHKAQACAEIDAHFIAATRPGSSLADVFHHGVEAYAQVGFANEWQLHHQGGLAGYEPREIIATPDATGTVEIGQAFAWNPSITGVKSEDTILIGESENEIITAIPNEWTTTFRINGQTIARPMILELT